MRSGHCLPGKSFWTTFKLVFTVVVIIVFSVNGLVIVLIFIAFRVVQLSVNIDELIFGAMIIPGMCLSR